ncbi:hypothetical protein HY086_04610 [Candidatus Gottesmanbacteria bacterium]|nr:hypothetical protein [Candidatus Gottesmanbacteria bacterium]
MDNTRIPLASESKISSWPNDRGFTVDPWTKDIYFERLSYGVESEGKQIFRIETNRHGHWPEHRIPTHEEIQTATTLLANEAPESKEMLLFQTIVISQTDEMIHNVSRTLENRG